MASRKSSRGAGGSPGPGSKRGERRRCGSEAVALGVLPRGSLPGRSGAYRRGGGGRSPGAGGGAGADTTPRRGGGGEPPGEARGCCAFFSACASRRAEV